jgi:hypothetical protein
MLSPRLSHRSVTHRLDRVRDGGLIGGVLAALVQQLIERRGGNFLARQALPNKIFRSRL